MTDLLVVQNPLTLKLAIFLGVFFIAVAIPLTRTSLSAALLKSIKALPGLMHAIGSVCVFVGLGILLAHWDFSSVAAALVTLIALWWTLEGIGMLALGHILPIDSPSNIRMYALANIPAVAIGVFLVIAGFFGHAATELTP